MRGFITALLALALAGCDSPGSEHDATTDTCLPTDDADGDGIANLEEGCSRGIDTDGDGIPDYLDEDSDGDGITDLMEGNVDSDGDRRHDFRDLDSDNNGIPDADEGVFDMDGDGIRDFADPDNDGDSLSDVTEIGADPTSPRDTDEDSIPDYMDFDSDDDTISDLHEQDADTDDDGIPDRLDLDTDGDRIPDAEEAGDSDIGTEPVDSDEDFIPDYQDLDSDNDSLLDAQERLIGTDLTSADSDMDGVSDRVEVEAGTDPLDATENPRTEGWVVFILYYNGPGTPPAEVREADPRMDHLLLETGPWVSGAVTAVLRDDPRDKVDTVADFIDFVEPSTIGGHPDPADPSRICVSGLEVADLHPPREDRPDSFPSVPTETLVCFDIHVKPNWTVRDEEDPQTFSCDVDLVDVGGRVLDTISVYFLIPPRYSP